MLKFIQVNKFLNDPVGYLKVLSEKEESAYYMGYEHAKQAVEKIITEDKKSF